jgi:glycolate oxidase FAD binding subunit
MILNMPDIVIDDLGPLPVVQPASVAELSDHVRRAAAEHQAIYPLGGRTMLGYGLPPTRPGIAVDLTRLTQVIDYPARDMTITVQAGITISRLQQLLRGENQRLPVDVARPEQATLGGTLAVNASGPRRYGFGTLRDYVIGLSAVNDEGHEIKGGGRVVKNVAGYDLPKLFIGSLGTLGIITQVTLKLRPLAEERAVVLLGCTSAGAATILDELHRSRTRPVCIDVLNDAAVRALNQQTPGLLPEAPRLVVVGFEEKSATVVWQLEQVEREVSAAALLSRQTRVGAASDALWNRLTDLPLWAEAGLSFKASLLPSATTDFIEQAASLPDGLVLQAHAGSGIVVGHAPRSLTRERAAAMLTLLQGTAVAAHGNLVILRCPPEWKATLPVWGTPRDDGWLMRTVKEKLDPRNVFNPGRFLV